VIYFTFESLREWKIAIFKNENSKREGDEKRTKKCDVFFERPQKHSSSFVINSAFHFEVCEHDAQSILLPAPS